MTYAERILDALDRHGAMLVGELASILDVSTNAVSPVLTSLKTAGKVERLNSGKWCIVDADEMPAAPPQTLKAKQEPAPLFAQGEAAWKNPKTPSAPAYEYAELPPATPTPPAFTFVVRRDGVSIEISGDEITTLQRIRDVATALLGSP